jgi:hypothetical protein
MPVIVFIAIFGLLLSACTPMERRADLAGSATGGSLTAGIGDTVMDFQLTRPLPNAFGQADIFGRRTNAGRIVVRLVGIQGGAAVFERSDINVESNATTMNQTPLIVPQVSRTTVDGMVGRTSVSGTETTTSYSVVGPRPTQQVVSASRPVQIVLSAGQSAPIQGRTLQVLQVGSQSVSYSVR